MNLQQIEELTRKPELYEKGTAVMWTDPYISQQLLELHLNPDHDIASRNKASVDRTIGWILSQVPGTDLKILDLGCGPGLYAEQLALKGHRVTGIDFSENTVQYAAAKAQEKGLAIDYRKLDYLHLEYENEFDLAILIYLDFCVLLPYERNQVLRNIYRSLKKGGIFIFDVVNELHADKKIMPQSWEIKHGGFWHPGTYMALNQGYHFPESKVLANKHVIVSNTDAQTYIFWTHYYSRNIITEILTSAGFNSVQAHENVIPARDDYWSGENITFYVAAR